jgi:primosomal protein N' (replication factor Y)
MSSRIYDIIKEYIIDKHEDLFVNFLIGPNPAPIEKIKNNYRWQIIIKSSDDELEGLKSLLTRVCILDEYKIKEEGIKISIDINPNTIL